MSKLSNFFKKLLKEKTKLTNSSSGKNFEDKLILMLKKSGFNMVSIGDDKIIDSYLLKIKPNIQKKLDNKIINNTLYSDTQNIAYKDFFIWQPYGTQNFPDFLVFTEFKIFTIESKYSTKNQNKPLWNSNLPKKDSLYIFGCYEKRDITFFRGEDILPEKERKIISKIWDETDMIYKTWEKLFEEKLKTSEIKNEYGFSPYIRKAYQQTKAKNENAILDFFNNTNRSNIEKQTISFIDDNDKTDK